MEVEYEKIEGKVYEKSYKEIYISDLESAIMRLTGMQQADWDKTQEKIDRLKEQVKEIKKLK